MKKFKRVLLSSLAVVVIASSAIMPSYASEKAKISSQSIYAYSWIPSGYYYGEPTIKKGSTGSYVTRAQERLKFAKCYTGSIDGIFGSATETAVKKFQAKVGIAQDGIIGFDTWSWLNYVYSEGILI